MKGMQNDYPFLRVKVCRVNEELYAENKAHGSL